MAYSSLNGRKPMERASKISHTNIIASQEVKDLLADCSIPRPADTQTVQELLVRVPASGGQTIKHVIAVDGSFREALVRDEFPSATITFFAFGPLIFKLDDLRQLDRETFIAPEDLAKLKKIQRFQLALPTRNISRSGLGLQDSIRLTLHEFLARRIEGDKSLYDTLRWLIYRRWANTPDARRTLRHCPNKDVNGCGREEIVLTADTPYRSECTSCRGPIYLADILRLHELVDDEQGASRITSYLLSALETLALVHVIHALWEMKPILLREFLFIKDGPLALFGQVFTLADPLRDLANFLASYRDPADQSKVLPLLNVVGLEKSGSFVEHAVHIEKSLGKALSEAQSDGDFAGVVLPLSNDYIYKYVVPGDPGGTIAYGQNTYWGGKMIFKAKDGSTYVATVPTLGGHKSTPKFEDYINLTDVLAAVSELRCSMYDNALIPVALANRLVSLSEVPSSRILENFARGTISRS
ncbi:DNA double-strand break repair nuclease NurA [Streptomyces sp. McG3]|uniref:DNA double-strand break repair nuclease NurA n=1 Tax=Streptomyces sp. McG3 TaxID=2725483 RepID=UPI001BEAE49D|nr:DNA double-strand break repair nuclease NurA [Streptomyces sp. McG3]MBT2899331.1 DNA double-strand break repair nuclease NurA [Streptomyces sp. McG3]